MLFSGTDKFIKQFSFESGMGVSRGVLWRYVLFRLILLLAFIASLFNRNWIGLGLSLVLGLLVVFPEVSRRRMVIENPKVVEVFVLGFLCVYIVVTGVNYFYDSIWWWDSFLRVVLGMMMVLIGFFLVYLLNSNKKASLYLDATFITVFSFAFGVSSGLLWELFKYLLEFFFRAGLQTPNIEIVMQRMILFVSGCVLAAVVGFFHLKFTIDSPVRRILSMVLKGNPDVFAVAKPSDYVRTVISEGESEVVEFKSALRTNLHTNQHDKRIEHAVLKTVAAFLNTSGGTLVVGVDDSGKVIGLDHDNFKSSDKLELHFSMLVEKDIGGQFNSCISYRTVTFGKKFVLLVRCYRSKKPVFVKGEAGEEFYVRSGPSSKQLDGSKMVAYISSRFGKKL